MPIYPKEYIDGTRSDVARSNCFVLMPLARQFDGVHHAIRSACEVPALLLSCSRADDFYGAGQGVGQLDESERGLNWLGG